MFAELKFPYTYTHGLINGAKKRTLEFPSLCSDKTPANPSLNEDCSASSSPGKEVKDL
jgi:hypothetical protein